MLHWLSCQLNCPPQPYWALHTLHSLMDSEAAALVSRSTFHAGDSSDAIAGVQTWAAVPPWPAAEARSTISVMSMTHQQHLCFASKKIRPASDLSKLFVAKAPSWKITDRVYELKDSDLQNHSVHTLGKYMLSQHIHNHDSIDCSTGMAVWCHRHCRRHKWNWCWRRGWATMWHCRKDSIAWYKKASAFRNTVRAISKKKQSSTLKFAAKVLRQACILQCRAHDDCGRPEQGHPELFCFGHSNITRVVYVLSARFSRHGHWGRNLMLKTTGNPVENHSISPKLLIRMCKLSAARTLRQNSGREWLWPVDSADTSW